MITLESIAQEEPQGQLLSNKDYYYSIRYKKKKNNKTRVIHAPSPKLKKIQKEFADWFLKLKKLDFKFAEHLTGFMPGKSISDNAKPHLEKDWVINMDIQDFFPTIDGIMGKIIFSDLPQSKSPFYWFKNKKPTAFKNMQIDDLLETMFLKKDSRTYQLPQGSPASPILANYVGLKIIDPQVFKITHAWSKNLMLENLSYTRYADDLTISFNYPHPEGRKAALLLSKKIKEQIESSTPFRVKEGKTIIKHKSQRQAVTGVIVNGAETRINRKLINNMRAAIYNAKKNNEDLNKETIGMLSFIQSVNKEQYNKLMKQTGELVCK